MYGYVEEGKCACLVPRQVAGVWLLWMTLPRGGAFCHLRRRKLWRRLRASGVRRAVLPRHLIEEAADYGIYPVEVYPLRRGLLPQLLDCCGSLRGKTVRLQAEFVTAEVQWAAEELALRARYLDLQAGQGSEQLAAYLQRQYGLAVGAVGAAALTVCFHGTAEGKCLHLGEDCAARQTVAYHVDALQDADIAADEQLIAALFALGAVEKEQIHIKSIASNA